MRIFYLRKGGLLPHTHASREAEKLRRNLGDIVLAGAGGPPLMQINECKALQQDKSG